MPGQSDPLFSLGYWIVSHKATLKTWWGVSLLLIMFVGGLWVAVFFGFFFSQESQIDHRFQTELTRLSSWSPARIGMPAPLAISDPTVLSRSGGRSDVVVMITNSNSAWGATDINITCTNGTDTINFSPVNAVSNGVRAVMALGQKIATPDAVSCSVTSQVWHRSVAALFSAPTFTVLTSNVHATTVTVAGQIVPSVTIDATIRNDSGDNIAGVDVPIVVRNDATVVAVDELTIDRWATREVKHVADTWTGTSGGATAVDIIPQINIFSSDARF